MQGWIKLHRKIIDSSVFENPKLLKTWIWCICKASHTEHEVVVGKQIVNLKPGQFVFGRLKAAQVLQLNERTVYDYMQMLKKLGMISIDSNNKFSVVTIVNWGLYQGDESENQHQTTIIKAQQDTIEKHTNKNAKECSKNDKKHIYGSFGKVRLTDEEKERLIAEFGEAFFAACVKELDEYKEQSGKVYRNDNLAIRKWVIDAVKKKGGETNAKQKTEQRSEYEKISL